MTNTIRYIFKTHHRGKQNAITRREFFDRYGYRFPDLTDREFRHIYADTLRLPTCQKGIFYPEHPNELDEFEADCISRINKISERLRETRRMHFPEREGVTQGRLF
jgi:hypothetical protein